jgi:hypothetical protein
LIYFANCSFGLTISETAEGKTAERHRLDDLCRQKLVHNAAETCEAEEKGKSETKKKKTMSHEARAI